MVTIGQFYADLSIEFRVRSSGPSNSKGSFMNSILDINSSPKRLNASAFIFLTSLVLFFLLGALLYYYKFTIHLGVDESNLEEFLGVISHDSLMYTGESWIAIDVNNLDFSGAIEWFKNYPTLLPMTVLTYGLQQLGVSAIYFNLTLIICAGWVLFRFFWRRYGSLPICGLLFIFLNTLTIFYSQSFTKEPILLLLATFLVTSSLDRCRWQAILALIGIGVIRLPFLIPSTLFVLWSFASPRYNILKQAKLKISFMLIYCLIVPLIFSQTGLYRAAEINLSNIQQTSGVTFEYLQIMKIPGVPLLFLPIKIMQNLLEPLFSLRMQLMSEKVQLGYLMSVSFAVLNFLAIVFLCWILGARFFNKLLGRRSPPVLELRDSAELQVFLILVITFFSFLPFVQMRYIYPVAPIIGLLIDQLLLPRLAKVRKTRLSILEEVRKLRLSKIKV